MICELQQTEPLNSYPNIHFNQIDKDMPRTFPTDPFYTDEIKQSMTRILKAYVIRNPTVGYI